jgi:hypothetical protein
MHEFRAEKRDISRMQLFINHKNQELHRLEVEQTVAERQLVSDAARIAILEGEYKQTTIRIEAAVARQVRIAEVALRNASEKARALWVLRQETERIRSDILKNEGFLEAIIVYRDFLVNLCPGRSDVMAYFHHPSVLLDEMHRVEHENLLIIQEYQHLHERLNAAAAPFRNRLEQTEQQELRAHAILAGIRQVEEIFGDLQPGEESDAECVRVASLVRKAYAKCFGGESDLSPLAILEKLENELEKMYRLEACVSPDFRAQKGNAKAQERREQQRRTKQALQKAEQQRKVQQAIERARKPMPRRWGRKVVERVIPIKEKKRAFERAEGKRREEERVEKLLFEENE